MDKIITKTIGTITLQGTEKDIEKWISQLQFKNKENKKDKEDNV